MKLSSPAFKDRGVIPVQYTCLGENISPPFLFENVPPQAQSLLLAVVDRDASPKPWIHWLVLNIPPSTLQAREGEVPTGGTEGLANGGTPGYEGPCPKYFTGTHHYEFRLIALDTTLPATNTLHWDDVEPMVADHRVTEAVFTGIVTSSPYD